MVLLAVVDGAALVELELELGAAYELASAVDDEATEDEDGATEGFSYELALATADEDGVTEAFFP
jgi:hypothetical protein